MKIYLIVFVVWFGGRCFGQDEPGVLVEESNATVDADNDHDEPILAQVEPTIGNPVVEEPTPVEEPTTPMPTKPHWHKNPFDQFWMIMMMNYLQKLDWIGKNDPNHFHPMFNSHWSTSGGAGPNNELSMLLPFMNWNHWATTGGAGPNNQPSVFSHHWGTTGGAGPNNEPSVFSHHWGTTGGAGPNNEPSVFSHHWGTTGGAGPNNEPSVFSHHQGTTGGPGSNNVPSVFSHHWGTTGGAGPNNEPSVFSHHWGTTGGAGPNNEPPMFNLNHWGTTGGAGPNNEPGVFAQLPPAKLILDTGFKFQPPRSLPDNVVSILTSQNKPGNCIPPGQHCFGVGMPCCSSSVLKPRFCASYADRCL